MFILCMYCVWLCILKKVNAINVAQAICLVNIFGRRLGFLLGDSENRMGGALLLNVIGISLNACIYYYLGHAESVEKFILKDYRYLKNIDYFLIDYW